jgi:hypothetical protein
MGFFNDLLGKSSAKSATQLGQRNMGEINRGYDRADTVSGEGYNRQMGLYQPLAEQAQRGNQLYGDAYGVNGAEAQGRAFQQYRGDPFYAHADQQTSNMLGNLMRKWSALGMSNSGNSGMSLARAGLDAQDRRIGEWRGGLGQFANQSQGYADRMSGVTGNYYGGMADRAVGRTNALTQNDTQATMAANNARQQGVSNVLGLGGMIGNMAMSAATGMPVGTGSGQRGGTSPGGVSSGGTWAGGGSGGTWQNPDWNYRGYQGYQPDQYRPWA